MARPRNWIKLWVSWLTTPAHFDLSEGAFGLGPLLLLMCTWDGDHDSGGWLLNEDGAPMDRKTMARVTHRERARLDSQLTELVRCKTLTIRSDGALGFPGFGHWQETSSAKRTRTYRDKHRHGDSGSDAQTEDGRDQNSSSSGRKTAKRESEPDPYKPAVDRVLQALHEARIAVKPGLTRLRKRDHIRARLAEGRPIEHLLTVIAFGGEECRKDPSKLQWLDTVTPFRPKNWEQRLARAQAWQGTRGGANGRAYDTTPEEQRRLLEEAAT